MTSERSAAVNAPVLISAYFLSVLLLGALAAPLLWELGHWLIGFDWVQKVEFVHGNLAKSEFDRYFRRAALLAAVLLFVPFYRKLALSWRDVSLRFEGRDCWAVGRGFLLAGGILLLLGWLQLRAGAYVWREGGSFDWGAIPGALVAGFAVGLLEEWFFRLIIFGLVLRTMSVGKAALFVTLLFAVLHFFVPPDALMLVPSDHYKVVEDSNVSDLPQGEMRWWTGLWLVGITLANVADMGWWLHMIAEFSTLFAVGYVLVRARMLTGNIWLGVGLHAGWVFGLKFFAASTFGAESLDEGEWLPWVGKNLKVGLIPCVTVALTGLVALSLERRVLGKPRRGDG